MSNKKRNKWILAVILMLQILLLMYLTWKFGTQRLDGDDSAEMILANLLAREGGLLSRNWLYSTEIRVLNTQIVMSLLFRIFDDWRLVRTLGTGILLCILASSYLFMCRNLPEGDHLAKWAPVLLLPFSYVYYDIVLFGLYYIPHISILFTSLGLLTQKKKNSFLTIILLVILAFFAGMGGIRIPAVGYAPMFAAGLLMWLMNRNNKQLCLRSFIACVATGVGYLVNLLVLRHLYQFQSRSYIRPVVPDLHSAATVAKNTVQVFGGGKPALSFAGFSNTAGLLIFLCGIFLLVLIVKERKHVSSSLQFVILAFIISWFATALAGVCTNNGWSNRYAILPCMGMIPVLAGGTGLFKEKGKRTLTALLTVCFLICSTNYIYRFAKEDKLETVRPAYQYILDSGFTFGYSNWEVGDVLTEITDGKVHMCKVQNFANLWRWGWLMEKDYMKYTEGVPVFLLLDKGRFTSVGPDRGYFYGEWTEADMIWKEKAKVGFEDENYVVWVFSSEKEFEEITGSLPLK